MRKTKYAIVRFSFYDRTGIQNYLESQARKGWMLEKSVPSPGNSGELSRRISTSP